MSANLSEVYQGKRVMITGGLGFLGSNLAHRLVELGANLILVDAMLRGQGGNLFNIQDIFTNVAVNFSDVRDRNSFHHLVKNQQYIFNLVGTHNSQDSIASPLNDLEINCEAHLSVLASCRRYNPDARIVFCGARNQYGRTDNLPVSEEHPLQAVEINGVHNSTVEAYYLLYGKLYGIGSTCLRLTNTYGPRHIMQHHKLGVVNWFIKLIQENREVCLFGDGRQIRDIIYVSDAVEAMLLAAASDQALGRVYNLGGTPISLEDLVKKMIELTGKGGYKFIPYPDQWGATDQGNYIADYSRIKQELDWEPQVSLEYGLSRTIDFYQKYKKYYW